MRCRRRADTLRDLSRHSEGRRPRRSDKLNRVLLSWLAAMPAIPRKAFATAAAVVVLLLSNPAPATVVPRLDLPDLVHTSELILHGRIVRHWSDWDQAHQFIWTRYLLEVQEALKGHP